LLNVVHQHSPQTGIVFTEQIGHRIDGRLGAQQHHECFHHQGETAAFPCPGHLHLMDPVLATPGSRHLGHQFTAVLEKVQMPPAPLDGVMYSTQSFTVRTLKMFSRHMLQAQFQAFGFSLEAALGHSPLR
jgi:hypothetical protein